MLNTISRIDKILDRLESKRKIVKFNISLLGSQNWLKENSRQKTSGKKKVEWKRGKRIYKSSAVGLPKLAHECPPDEIIMSLCNYIT